MQKFFLVLFLVNNAAISFAQKPVIDTGLLSRWPTLNNPHINNVGNYVSYVIENKPVGVRTLIIESSNHLWNREFIGPRDFHFLSSNREGFFQIGDSLCFIHLGTDQIEYVAHVSSYKLTQGNESDWLAYQLKNANKDLILHNQFTGKEYRFASVTDYSFSKKGNTLLVVKAEPRSDSLFNIALQWVNLPDIEIKTIWTNQDSKAENLSIFDCRFDDEGNQLVFMSKGKRDGLFSGKIWYYASGKENAEVHVDNRTSGIDSTSSIEGPLEFSKNGNWIFFQVQQATEKKRPQPGLAMVDIWSYKDAILQPAQTLLPSQKASKAVVNSIGVPAIRIFNENERIETNPDKMTGDFIVIADNYVFNSFFPYWWTLSPQPSFYVLSLNDGSRKLLKKESYSLHNFVFSPQGRYLIYYDWKKEYYYSYDCTTGSIRNISRNVPTQFREEYQREIYSYEVGPIVGWLERDDGLLVYDNYDIWRLDPAGNKLPINVTNGYGLRHHIKLRLVNERDATYNNIIYTENDSLLLDGFNDRTKYNGFYWGTIAKGKDPKMLTMGPYTFYHTESQISGYVELDRGMQPIKASSVNRWIVKRENANEAPNYFLTDDFIKYSSLSNLQPQLNYNWLTTELINWKQIDGTISQGILYKPENFDPHEKYPIIFHFYERLSHRLFEFPELEYTVADLNIPWFVSHGYLVFTPDIHYKVANISDKTVGEWAYNSVVSAALYLCKLPYVDKKRMAIQGHSFGGLEANYLVTHTHLFAAAAEAAGSSDPISAYLTLIAFPFGRSIESYSKQLGIEMSHELYGVTPWQRPDLYRRNSAVLNADRVTTPLLIMHNKLDNQVQWRQGIELYMALRRLGKKVWMLQYDDESHVIVGRNAAMDYTIRLTQFFDYYLKDTAPPKWMTKGVPTNLKGIESGYDLDESGKIP